MDLRFTFFSTKGRIGRQHFWFALLALIAAAIVCSFIMLTIVAIVAATGAESVENSRQSITAFLIGNLLLFALFFFPSLAIFVKRFHDKDKKGTILYVYYGLLLASHLLLGGLQKTSSSAVSISGSDAMSVLLSFVLGIAATGIGLYIIIICGFLKGTEGPNQFGEDPLADV